jgi:alkylhydroperoxidase/carboxymuconolactone decarboxylase family protein YurZ
MVPAIESLIDEFIRLNGYWNADIDHALRVDPEFFAAYLKLSSPPTRPRTLDSKTRELVLIAVNAAVTHLREPEISEHMRCALRLGASRAEILEVLQLVSVLGMHGFMLGAPILMRELGGVEAPAGDSSEKADKIKRQFMEGRKYWSELLEDMVSASPEFFEAYGEFSSVPWRTGTLDPKTREFIYVAIDASTTHLHVEGLRIHMKNALRHGATLVELVEVLQIVSCIGIQSWFTGVRLLDRTSAEEARDQATR